MYNRELNSFTAYSGTIASTPGYNGDDTFAPGDLSWTSDGGRWTVTLSNFSFVRLAGLPQGTNLVGDKTIYDLGSDRTQDYIGRFTLSVVDTQAIPEPSSALLLLLASSGCVAYRRHKNKKKLSPELANA